MTAMTGGDDDALIQAMRAGDEAEVRRLREAIIRDRPESPLAAECHFRLGLEALFSRRDLDAAAEHFRAAGRLKHAPWSESARLSLASILMRQGRTQQAIFELRKVVARTPESLLTAQAYGMMTLFLSQSGQTEAADRAQKAHHALLRRLQTDLASAADRASATYLLGEELLLLGQRAEALAAFESAIASGALDQTQGDRAVQRVRMLRDG